MTFPSSGDWCYFGSINRGDWNPWNLSAISDYRGCCSILTSKYYTYQQQMITLLLAKDGDDMVF